MLVILAATGVQSAAGAQIVEEYDASSCTDGVYGSLPGTDANNLLRLQCSFSSEQDEITIYLTSKEFDVALPWQENINDRDAVWLFDANSNGFANLIIRFSSDQASVTAELYDDVNGDGQVSYLIDEEQIIVTETDYPAVRVRSADRNWRQKERLNYNLDLEVDGPVIAMASYHLVLDRLANDGQIDFQIKVRDTDGDGIPEYDLRRDTSGLPLHWSLYRLNLIVDASDRPKPVKDYVLWPLLGSSSAGSETAGSGDPEQVSTDDAQGYGSGLVQKDFSSMAPLLQVDWENSKIDFIAEMVSSRATESSWFTYSLEPFEPDELYEGNFEYPFAFYDLAADGDGRPELLIRAESYSAHDFYYYGGAAPTPNTMIRYVWKQNNLDTWDYSVNLLGPFSTASTPVEIDDNLALRIIPYDKFPDWVLDETKEWDAITFVQATSGVLGLEGIYEWSDLNDIRDAYAAGMDVEPHLQRFSTIAEGFRGEYAVGPSLKPQLYFSPIDGQLHLQGANGGLWNIDGQQKIHYQASGGPYINHWSLFDNDELIEEIFWGAETIILQEKDTVHVANAEVSDAIFHAAPPRNSDEWEQLGSRLREHRSPVTATNFRGMFDQFEGPRMQIDNAYVSEFRVSDEGVRFVLELMPEFQISGKDLLQLKGLDSGKYVISLTGEEVELTPLTQAQVHIELEDASLDTRGKYRQISIINTGGRDLNQVHLVAELAESDGAVNEFNRISMDVYAGDTQTFILDVPPEFAGGDSIRYRLEDDSGQTLAQVTEADPIEEAPAITADRLPGSGALSVIALFAFIMLVLAAGFSALARKEQGSHP